MSGTVDKYEVNTRHPETGRYVRYRVRYELPPDPYTGKRRQAQRGGFPTLAAAERYRDEVAGSVRSGSYVPPSRQRLATYLASWLDSLSVKETTRDNYRTSVEVHVIPRLGGIALSELTAEEVDGLYRTLERHGKSAGACRTAGVTCREHRCTPDRHEGLSPKSVRHVHTALRKALEDAMQRGYVGRNVADLANPPTQRAATGRRARDKAWTSTQLRTFLDVTASDRLAPLWHLLSTTGLRRGEALGLRWSDLDLDRSKLRVAQTVTEVRGRLIVQASGKTDAAERTLSLDASTVEVLRRWRLRQLEERMAWPGEWPDGDLVFTRQDGEGLRPKRLSSDFVEAAARAGLPAIGMHGLRHSYATAALRAGVSPEVVSKRLGHSSVVMTLTTYAHVFEQDDEAAAELAAAAILGA